jgi:hypothetical protein
MVSSSEWRREGIASIVDRQLDKSVDRSPHRPVFGLVMRLPIASPDHRASAPGSFRWSKRRRLVIWGVVALAVSGLAYGALWLMAANHFRAATLTWIEQRHGEGYRISHTRLETGGFPAVVRITLSDPTITGRGAGGSWSWSGEEAVAEISPLDPEQVTVRLAGDQRLGHAVGARRFYYEGSAAELTVDATSGGWLPVGAVTIRDLTLRPVDGGDDIDAARIDVAARGDPGANADDRTVTYELTLEAADVGLPRALGLPLGGDVTRLALTAKLIGTLEAGPWPQALDRWRDAGGTLEVTRLELLYGPLTLTADGTLALDEANQPIGAFNARIVGAARTVDALRRRGLIEDMNAAAAKMVLGLMAREPADGGEPIVEIPLTLQNRILHAGPVALAVIPEIRWRKTERKKP